MADKKRPVGNRNGEAKHSSKKTAPAPRPAKPGKQTSVPGKAGRPRKKANERRRQKKALKMNEAAYRHIVDAMEDLLTVLDADGTILFANGKAALNLSGGAPSTIIGKNISQFIPATQVKSRLKLFRRVITAGRPFEQELMVTLQGADRWFMNILTPVSFGVHNIPALVSSSRDITDRKRIEDALQRSEKRYRQLFENMKEGFLIQDVITDDAGNPVDARYLDINPAIERFLGKTRAEIIGKTRNQVLGIPDPAVVDVVGRVALTGQPFHLARYSSGAKRWYESFSYSFGPGQVATLVLDITERTLAEDRLRESEDKFRSIFEQATDGIMIADAETKRHMEANSSMCRMLGYTHDEIIGLSVDDIHPSGDLPAIRGLFEKQLRGEISLASEVPMVRKDGSVFYADINSAPVLLGGKHCLLGLFRDITERKRANAALGEREKQLAESQRIAHIGSFEHNLTTGKVVWSDELFHLLGLDPGKDPADFKMFFDMIHPDDRQALKKAIDETVKTGRQFSVDYRFNLRDGATRTLHAQAELIRDAAGNQTVLSGTAQDITERKQAEEKIRQNEEFIRGILDTVDEGFIVIDRDYRILTANKAYCGQTGRPCDDIIGKRCFEISHKLSRPCYEEGEECAVRQVFATGKPHTVLHKHSDHEGHALYVETKGFPVKDSEGNVTSVIETINNITEKHLLEEERLKTQKLESIGTLAGGIAHDFNNLLQGVFGYISMAKMTFSQKEKSLAMLEQAEKALHQSVNLTTQLLTFSKGGKPVKKRLSLAPVIQNAAKFALSGSRSSCILDVAPGLWQVDADEGQVGQVLQNIVLNADQAMPVGGTVTVTAANAAAGDAPPPPGLAAGNYVVISIRDTGVGIPERYLGKIFDPYFTTKEKGSGLGLATSYSIVRNHGGMIEVRTKSGEGSTFTIYLPALAGEGRTASAVSPGEPSPPRSARVLVMDDEELIRKLSSEILNLLGHDVEVAKHGREALEKYQGAMAAGRPFDIVILDLTVRGGMGGSETIQKLFEIDPAVKAIVSSGYSDDIAAENFEKQGFKAFLKKPYDIDALREVLNKMLAI